MVAAKQDTEGISWHAKCSIESTEVLGRLACLVLSNILGIGMAERNWKQVKKVKKRDRKKTGVDKTTKSKQVFILCSIKLCVVHSIRTWRQKLVMLTNPCNQQEL
jgi:hypothetical protein